MCSGGAGSQDLPVLEHNVSYASVMRVERRDEKKFSFEVVVLATVCSPFSVLKELPPSGVLSGILSGEGVYPI